MAKKPNYPECEKLMLEANVHRTLNEFIEWLYDNGYSIKHYERKVTANTNSIVYGFMNVDEKKLEAERKKMLESIAQ